MGTVIYRLAFDDDVPDPGTQLAGMPSATFRARATQMNREIDGWQTEVIAIEPYPAPVLEQGVPGLARLVRQPIEAVELPLFETLARNDILFIDSTHALRVGGDVAYEFLEILPRLRPGVLIHIHDIFLPYHYPKQWVVKERKFWNEQYLLQALLMHSAGFEVVWASSYMSVKYQARLEDAFPNWPESYLRLPARFRELTRDGRNVWPVSFWIRRLE